VRAEAVEDDPQVAAVEVVRDVAGAVQDSVECELDEDEVGAFEVGTEDAGLLGTVDDGIDSAREAVS
jgi:hypothetical protein